MNCARACNRLFCATTADDAFDYTNKVLYDKAPTFKCSLSFGINWPVLRHLFDDLLDNIPILKASITGAHLHMVST